MNPRVSKVKATEDYKLEFCFDSGQSGTYDCAELLGFGVFQELKKYLIF